MTNLVVNETPVRTSKNFNINHIKLENVEIPTVIPPFQNVTIKAGENSKINQNVEENRIVYGMSPKLNEMNDTKANQKINIEIKEESNIEIEFHLDKENPVLVEHIQINALRNTKSSIVIKYKGEDNEKFFHNGMIYLLAEENAEVHVTVVNFLNTISNHFLSVQSELQKESQVNYTLVDFGGKNSVTNYYANLLGASSENNVNTIYLGGEEQLIDLNYIAELRGQKSMINMDIQGALKDHAKKHFKGTIDFKKGCKKSKGDENEFCMLLSDQAKSIALPMLLCSEEDVEGNHASSAGKVGEKELFYIMSRGFTFKEAMKLIVRARFNHIISSVSDEMLREEILAEIDKRLG